MPIRINLLEEEQKQKLARKRDPMMLAIRLGGLAVVAVLVYSLILYAREKSLKEQLTALKNDWSLQEVKFAKVDGEIKNLQQTFVKTELLKTCIHNRFLWAPQLELYKDVIPNTVQITRLVGHREIVTPAPPTSSKAPPVFPMEVVHVTLEGVADGPRPELAVQNFLTKLKSDQKLSAYVEEVKLVSLNRGGSTGKGENESGIDQANARFVIEIQYKQRPIKQA
jgi:Tfp pilus assembly protein PilN